MMEPLELSCGSRVCKQGLDAPPQLTGYGLGSWGVGSHWMLVECQLSIVQRWACGGTGQGENGHRKVLHAKWAGPPWVSSECRMVT